MKTIERERRIDSLKGKERVYDKGDKGQEREGIP